MKDYLKHFKRLNWQILLGAGLIVLSGLLYLIHYTIFQDSRHIFLYFFQDLAFVPIEVLLVTLIIHQLLNTREKRALLQKMNMVIGTFFSEVGTDLIHHVRSFSSIPNSIEEHLILSGDWSDRQFSQIRGLLKDHSFDVDCRRGDLVALRIFLLDKRNFLLRLLENPNLLEHDSFTNLLWAVFHLADELGHRERLKKLSERDYQHLSGDIKRVFSLLVVEWLNYMEHLKKKFPYLFSLATRLNPFDPNAAVEFH